MFRKNLALVGIAVVICIGAAAAYGALPTTRSVDPSTVGIGRLVGATPLDIDSVNAFTQAIKKARGTSAVLEHVRFTSGQSTGWITSPGPKIVLVVGGQLTLTGSGCAATTYVDGEGFVTDLEVHKGDAGLGGADVYVLHLAPSDADALRAPADPPRCAA